MQLSKEDKEVILPDMEGFAGEKIALPDQDEDLEEKV